MKKVVLMLMLIPMLVSAKSLSDGLVAWYKFDGDAKDSSDNHLNGYVFGATPSPDRFGRKDHAMMFGDGKYVLVPNDKRLQDLCEKISVSVWIFPLEWYFGHWGPILCKGHIPKLNMRMVFDARSIWVAREGHFSLTKSPLLNQWQHVLFTYDGKSVEVYIDGNLVGSQKIDIQAEATDDSLSIGCDPPGHKEYFIGAMDDLRIYNRPLSRDEVMSLYHERMTKDYSKDAQDGVKGNTEKADDESEESADDACNEEETNDARQDSPFTAPTATPSQAQINKAIKIIAELCASDIKAAKNGDISNAELAKRFLAQVGKTENVPVKFVLLRNAYKRLLMAKSVGSAQKLFDKVEIKYGACFAVAMAKASDANLKQLLKSANTAGSAQKLSAQIDELSVCIEKIKAADEILKKSPANTKAKMDKAANCIKIGDWQVAFEIYKEMDNERGKIVRWEQSNPEERSKDYTAEKVGDYWWSIIGDAKEASALFRSVSRHAAYWYGHALEDGEMSEMKTELVKKRIARVPAISISEAKIKNVPKPTEDSTGKNKRETGHKDVVLVATSDREQTKWKYCLQQPNGNWFQPQYDDGDWYEGKSTFWLGRLRGAQGTIWPSHDIYLRKTFDCAYSASTIVSAALTYCIDDDIEIWLNGAKIYESGITTEYQEVKPMKAIVLNLKRGKNVLAVHAHNNDMIGGYVDVGITITVK